MLVVGKIFSINKLQISLNNWRVSGLKIVFTNGCFDIIHRGHIEYLLKAKSFGDILVVGLNSDLSVKKLKGNKRPIIGESDRAFILSNLIGVDGVIIFNDETPLQLISKILPDILVKGGDYLVENIVGKDIVVKNGGKVFTVPLTKGKSTTNIFNKICKLN